MRSKLSLDAKPCEAGTVKGEPTITVTVDIALFKIVYRNLENDITQKSNLDHTNL